MSSVMLSPQQHLLGIPGVFTRLRPSEIPSVVEDEADIISLFWGWERMKGRERIGKIENGENPKKMFYYSLKRFWSLRKFSQLGKGEE